MNSGGVSNDPATYHANVNRTFNVPVELDALARRLAGPALVRFSCALWRRSEVGFDLLGCAVRLRRDGQASPEPADGDQDVLFATIRRLWTTPIAPFLVDVHDYLGNDYFARAPFEVGLGRKMYLRLHPSRPSSTRAGPRAERLSREVRRGLATLDLAISERPFGPWAPLVTIALERPADLDGAALHFLSSRDGRGLHPRGFMNAVRRGVDWVSERAPVRRATAGAP